MMAERPMETMIRTALSRQFGAAITMLENALMACPASLWSARLWSPPEGGSFPSWIPPEFSQFWYVAYHTLFWLDLYLSGCAEEEFAPPAPFIWTELNPAVSPERPYTKAELRDYLAAMRRKCDATLSALTDEGANRTVPYHWTRGQAVTFLELQLLNLRHVQEHAAQLSLFLGEHGIQDEALAWVSRGKGADAIS